MDIVEMARACGLTVLLDGRIGFETYQSVSGPLTALRRFGDSYAGIPRDQDMLALFKCWAANEGLPLDLSQDCGRTFVWTQTEQAWFGFQGFAQLFTQQRQQATPPPQQS